MINCIRILALFFCFFHLQNSFAQAPPVQWQKSFGGTKGDLRAIIRNTADKGFIMAGFTLSNDGDYPANNGSYDIYLTKIDACGNKEWVQRFGGSGMDLVYGLAEAPDGGFFYAGTSFSTTMPGFLGGVHDGLLVRTNAQGDILWGRLIGGNDLEVLTNLVVLPDTSCVVAGYTASSNGDGQATGGSTDAWVVKVDKNGNVIWKKCFGGAGADAFFDLSLSNEEGFIATGYTTVSPNNSNLFLVKMDANGNALWQKNFGGSAADGARAVRRCTTGGYIAAGTTMSADGDVTGLKGMEDVWVLRVDESGNLLWQQTLGGTKKESLWEMTSLPNDHFIFAAGTGSGDGDITMNQGGTDALVFNMDADGTLNWIKTYGGSGHEEFFGVTLSDDGWPVMAGNSSSNDGDISGNHGQSDFIVMKLRPVINRTVDTIACGPIVLQNISVNNDTSFVLTLKDQCGYDSVRLQYNITVSPLPVVQTINDVTVSPGQQVTLYTNSTAPVQWTGTGLSCYNCLSPVASPVADSRFIVEAYNGNCKAADTVNIHIINPADTLYMPSAFTPNGDGKNDMLKPIGSVVQFSMRIFNRWGNELFYSKQVSKGWDGTYNGTPQPPGVYVYIIQYKTSAGLIRHSKGTVVLIR